MKYLLSGLLVMGCTGSIGISEIDDSVEPGPEAPPGPGAPPIDEEGNLICEEVHVPATTLRRLTRDQYDATVNTLFGDDTGPARAFPADDDIEGFLVAGVASPLLVEQQAAVAEVLAERASMSLLEITGCGDASCVDEAIVALGSRAYRRPLTDAEATRLRGVYNVGAMGSDEAPYRAGMRLTIQAMLQSPYFLYHLEPEPSDAGEEIVPVESLALASRLSYFVWGTAPDEILLQRAAEGQLDTLEGLLTEADRLIADERAKDGFRSFYAQWLKVKDVDGIVKDGELYPDFDAEVAEHLQRSLELFLDDVFESGNTELLFTGTTHYINAVTAPYFNRDASEFGAEFEAMDLGERRSGVLTHPALMALLAKANQSDPIHRALFVRERMLCQHLPPPPDDLVVVAPDPEPGLTTRERFADHSRLAACRGCHNRLDPLGFGFEHYDAVGAWRDTDNGTPVDSSGEVMQTEDADGPFDGVTELSARLGQSNEVRACIARQLFRFALQRNETGADACSLQGVDESFGESGYDLKALIRGVIASDAFRFQRVQ